VEAANGATTTEVNPPGDERGVAGLATPKQTGVITPGSALENSPLPTESPAAGRQLWHPRSTGANSILTELADISQYESFVPAARRVSGEMESTKVWISRELKGQQSNLDNLRFSVFIAREMAVAAGRLQLQAGAGESEVAVELKSIGCEMNERLKDVDEMCASLEDVFLDTPWEWLVSVEEARRIASKELHDTALKLEHVKRRAEEHKVRAHEISTNLAPSVGASWGETAEPSPPICGLAVKVAKYWAERLERAKGGIKARVGGLVAWETEELLGHPGPKPQPTSRAELPTGAATLNNQESVAVVHFGVFGPVAREAAAKALLAAKETKESAPCDGGGGQRDDRGNKASAKASAEGEDDEEVAGKTAGQLQIGVVVRKESEVLEARRRGTKRKTQGGGGDGGSMRPAAQEAATKTRRVSTVKMSGMVGDASEEAGERVEWNLGANNRTAEAEESSRGEHDGSERHSSAEYARYCERASRSDLLLRRWVRRWWQWKLRRQELRGGRAPGSGRHWRPFGVAN